MCIVLHLIGGNYKKKYLKFFFQIAAQNCRKRKTDQIAVLEDEVGPSTKKTHTSWYYVLLRRQSIVNILPLGPILI